MPPAVLEGRSPKGNNGTFGRSAKECRQAGPTLRSLVERVGKHFLHYRQERDRTTPYEGEGGSGTVYGASSRRRRHDNRWRIEALAYPSS
jgi:hypothetical protein